MATNEEVPVVAMTQSQRTEFATAFAEAVTEKIPAAIELRRQLHSDPHLSGHEAPATAQIVAHLPCEMTTVAGTGAIGRIGPEDGPSIAIRAELDALPLVEATGAPYQASGAAMHGCGHDVHQAALVAVAQAAAALDLPYALVPLLQPREESYPSGANDIVRSGVLRKHLVGAIIAAHVHPRIAVGSVATGHGPTNAAADEVRLTVHGSGGHGAYPHEANNPITALTHIINGLDAVIRRTVSPMNPTVLTVSYIRGGQTANVIPDQAQCAATLRTMVASDRDAIHSAIRQYARGQAASLGVTVDVDIVIGEPVLQNDSDLVDRVDARLRSLGFDISEPLRSCGADDFSFYSNVIPGVMAFVGVHTDGVTPSPSLHHPRFLPDENSVGRVALTLAAAYIGACDLIDDRSVPRCNNP